MELIETDGVGLTVRFTNQEYADLMGIAHCASIDYGALSRGFLDLSKERVWEIEDKIFEMSRQARSMERNAKR